MFVTGTVLQAQTGVNQAPTVDAGPDQAIVSPSSASLSGVATDDGLPNPPAGLTYSWIEVSGPGTTTFADATAASTTVSFSVAGTYTLRLTADDSNLTGSDDIVVTVAAANTAPVVNAGADQTITFPGTAALSGAATDDGLPNPPAGLTYSWIEVNGPGTATFADATAASTTASFSVAGTYTLRLTADDSNLTGSDDIVVTVAAANTAPVVDAGPDQNVAWPDAATLDGSATDDGLPNPPGTLTFQWTVMSGPGAVNFASATSAKTTATFSAAGAYALRLTANDGAVSNFDDIVMTVATAPLPSPWLHQDIGSVGIPGSASFASATFANRGSGTDIYGTADGFHYVYQTLTGDGKIVARVRTQENTNAWAKAGVMIRESLNPGAKNATVVISPGMGVAFERRSATNGTSTLTSVNGPGIAAPYWVKLIRTGNTFTGSRSSDGISWTAFSSATISMQSTVLIGLAVTSHDNAAASTATFDRVNLAPVANAGPDQTIALPTKSLTLNGSATDDGFPQGLLTYKWTKVNGPGTVTFNNALSASTTVSFSVAGTYTLRLTANDSQLAHADDVIVTLSTTPSPTPTPTPSPTPTPTPTPVGQSAVRINCGGPGYTDSLGQIWSADTAFVGGAVKTFTHAVTGTADEKLYQSERYATTLTYQVPVANGNYEVTLDFAEMYFNAAGKRVFNVSLEGQTLLQNFDIWALAGQYAAVQRTFPVTVSDGTLNVVATASVNTAKFSAIEIKPAAGDPYLHPVLGLPPYAVHYTFDSGPTVVSLIGHDSHTHEQGHALTSWTWKEGATLLGTTSDIDVPLALGQHTFTLKIGDDSSPARTESDTGSLTVYPMNAVGGVMTSYYAANGVALTQLIDSLPSFPDYKEVLPSLRINNLGGDIGGSPLSSNVVSVMTGNLQVTSAATYQFTLSGGSAARLFLDGNLVSGPLSLQAGTHSIEARFAVDSVSLLPAEVLASVNGAPAVAIAAANLTHDETSSKPFINNMPSSGSPQGGESVTISGLDFFPSGSVTVQWGSVILVEPDITVTPNSIRLLAPPGTGTVAVTVQTPNGVSNSISYTYNQGTVPISFTAPATVATLTSPTQAAWGPDGRLYVGSDTGTITIYTFADDYTVTNTQVVTTIAGLSNKSILGLAFNPLDPPSPVKLYVGHARLYAEGGGAFTGPAPYNGQVSVLTGPSFSAVQPLITRLPVANRDHAINGMTFDNVGDLLIANGSATNAGVPDVAMGTLPESPLSGAILKARLSKPSFNGALSYVETASGLTNNDQVYGDRVDVAPGTDVSVLVPGTRNPWDIVWTTGDMLYGSDNGANMNFGPVSTSATTQAAATNAADEINYLVEGHYYGHANRNRGRYDDRQNVYHLPTDPETFGTYNGKPLGTVASSSDGIDEYRATTFNSKMRGDLLVQKWKGVLYRAALAADGRSLNSVTTLASSLGLDVVAGPGGAILSTDYTNNKLVVLKPVDSGATSMVAYDIFPWRARADGSVSFTIGGAGFGGLADTTVKFGGVSATLTSVSATRIKGIIPANTAPSARLLDVTVDSAGSTSAIPGAFRYMLGTGVGSGVWKGGAPLPLGVGEAAAGAVNGVLYIVGGDTTATLAYDLKAGTWRSDLAVRPYPGAQHSAEVINGKFYLFGGIGAGSEGKVQIYDPGTNTWSIGAPAPYAGGSVSTSVIDGKAYMAGGIVGTGTVSTAAMYNPATNSWSAITSMPVGRNHAAAGTDGQKFFIFGGRTGGNTVTNGFNDVQIYTPSTNTWQWSGSTGSTIPPLPQARGGMGKAPFYGNEFYVMGGETTATGTGQVAGNVYDRVDVYNPATSNWRLETSMLTARHGISPVACDGRILVGAGGTQAGHSFSTVFELFSR